MQDKKKNTTNVEVNFNNANNETVASVAEHEANNESEEQITGENENSGNEDEIVKLKKETEEFKDKYLRLVAEFDNFKRRNAKERMELIQTAGKDVITSLLDVLDDMERAEKQMSNTDDISQIKEGVQLVINKLRNNLQSKGLKAMESVDTDFDVEKHEAITEIEVADDKKGKVVDEIVKGYYLNDKLIRFAKVVVGK